MNKIPTASSYDKGARKFVVRSRNERVELEMKILRYRKLARQIATDPTTQRRIEGLISDLEKELREIDE
jgi:hypothetical protein